MASKEQWLTPAWWSHPVQFVKINWENLESLLTETTLCVQSTTIQRKQIAQVSLLGVLSSLAKLTAILWWLDQNNRYWNHCSYPLSHDWRPKGFVITFFYNDFSFLGEIGGPLVCQRCDSCTWYIAGIMSFGDICGTSSSFGAFTAVESYEDWIAQYTNITIRKDGVCESTQACEYMYWRCNKL